MSGALIQIAAFGTQDIILMGNPTITFFKTVVKRHTNFAIDAIEQVMNGTPGFGSSNCSVSIIRDGDLLWRTFIRMKIPELRTAYSLTAAVSMPVTICPARWTDDIGHHIIDYIAVSIGGTQIDKHYGDWLQIWSQLTLDASKREGYNYMIGNRYELMGNNGRPVLDSNTASNFSGLFVVPEATIEVPLQFWFCRDPGLALPLISLPYHEIRIYFSFRRDTDLYIPPAVIGSSADVAKVKLAMQVNGALEPTVYCNYVFLDNLERKQYAQNAQEYLIEQLQYTNVASSNERCDVSLNFNHPTKELVWVAQKTTYIGNNDPSLSGEHVSASYNVANQRSNYQIAAYNAVANKWSTIDGRTIGKPDYGNMSTTVGCPIKRARLIINGTDRVRSNNSMFYNVTQPYMHHTCIPQSRGINVYSFALRPESIQPTGTINFSRIDNTTLHLEFEHNVAAGYGTTANVASIASQVNCLAPYVYEIPPKEAIVVDDTVTDQPSSAYLEARSQLGDVPGGSTSSVSYDIRVYALNFNVLRIVSGMGGLAYAN